ncbi:MAG: radical SAM protein, partial [Candidatus Omnitrophota bacterium]
ENFRKSETIDVFGPVYAEGIFDDLLGQGFHPFVQTHRGCPFTCTFCHTSDQYYSSMLFLSPEIFEQDMEYLGKRFQDKPNIALHVANTNMSLFKEDFAIAEVIRRIQDKYNWPKLIKVNSGKDPDKLIKMLSMIDFEPAIALQTLTPDVLENIKRKNIPFDKFVDFQNKISGKTGRLTFTELILCLPGETKESFLETLGRVINSDIENIVIYTLMNLKGTPLCSTENAVKYNYDIRHRIVPRQFSLINGSKILDTEEVIVATNAMSYQDYLELREISLTVAVFSSSAELAPLKRFVAEQNIDVAQWIFNIHDGIKEIPELNEVYKEFLIETGNELFLTKQALSDFFNVPENYRDLCSGKLGDNLLRKYKYIIFTKYCQQALKLAISKVRHLGSQSLNDMLRDLGEYLFARDIKRCLNSNSVDKTQYFNFNYDIQDWLTNNKEKLPLENFQGSFNFQVDKSDWVKKQFANIIEINHDFEFSLQVLYRDGYTGQFWPVWSKVKGND